MRRTGLLVVAGLAMLTAMLVLGAEVEYEPTLAADVEAGRSAVEAGHTVRLPVVYRYYDPAYYPPFGVTMYGPVNDALGLQVMTDAGARWVTTSLSWAYIEPAPGQYDWSSFDTTAQNAQAAGVDLYVLFTRNPEWAAQYGGGPVYDIQDLVGFATLMVERYDCDGTDDAPGHPCVRYWSFYAEPDNGSVLWAERGVGYWGHDGAGYAAMLAEVSPAMHAADPGAQVLIGGLAYDSFEPDGPFVRSFLTDTLTALNAKPGGATAYLDAVAFHFYPISTQRWPTIREKALEIERIMADNGVGNLPLISPEMGYWSSPTFGSSESEQANRLLQMYVQGLSVGVQPLSWYKVKDTTIPPYPAPEYPDMTSGLLRTDGSLKPAYYAYQTMTRELGWARYAGPFQAGGVEGYVFTLATGGDKAVLWSTGGTIGITFPYSHLRLVTATGDPEFDIWDNQRQPGAPGDADGGIIGQIELEIGVDQAVYVERK